MKKKTNKQLVKVWDSVEKKIEEQIKVAETKKFLRKIEEGVKFVAVYKKIVDTFSKNEIQEEEVVILASTKVKIDAVASFLCDLHDYMPPSLLNKDKRHSKMYNEIMDMCDELETKLCDIYNKLGV